MSSRPEALRLATALVGAFVAAEALDLQFAFMAGLIAIALAGQPRRATPALLLALPAIGWSLVTACSFLVAILGAHPLAMALALLLIFLGGFALTSRPRLASAGLLVLLVFAVAPTQLLTAPELAADMARWVAGNAALAAGSVFLVDRFLPLSEGRTQPAAASPPGLVLPPFSSALVLLAAVLGVVAFDPPGAAAALVGVIIVLRADAEIVADVVRNRLAAAVLGGMAALFVWEVALPGGSLLVLAAAMLLGSYLLAWPMEAGPSARDLAMKSLNVFVLLLGKGFSVIFDGAEDLFAPRLAGVLIGVGFALAGVVICRAAQMRGGREPRLQDG